MFTRQHMAIGYNSPRFCSLQLITFGPVNKVRKCPEGLGKRCKGNLYGWIGMVQYKHSISDKSLYSGKRDFVITYPLDSAVLELSAPHPTQGPILGYGGVGVACISVLSSSRTIKEKAEIQVRVGILVFWAGQAQWMMIYQNLIANSKSSVLSSKYQKGLVTGK